MARLKILQTFGYGLVHKECDMDLLGTGNDEVELFDKESSDPNDENPIDKNEVAEIFKIKTNILDFKTPMCRDFKEFNYLLQIDLNVLTKDINGFKTYDDCKDDWIYEWNEDVSWVHEKPWTDNGVWEEPVPMKHYLEWYEALEDDKLKEEDLLNKFVMEGTINKEEEQLDET
nr:hypothetical protein [Tanacetum cinerariifolium]